MRPFYQMAHEWWRRATNVAPAIQGGGQATRCGLPLINAVFYRDELISSHLSDSGKCPRIVVVRVSR
jgi:hypothetical protein